MAEPLKPCPHCGGEARLYHDTASDYERDWSYSVECTSCGGYFKTPEQAISEWNRRTEPPTDNTGCSLYDQEID